MVSVDRQMQLLVGHDMSNAAAHLKLITGEDPAESFLFSIKLSIFRAILSPGYIQGSNVTSRIKEPNRPVSKGIL